MSEKYFLTQQTANLREDFQREIEAGSSISLLYGASGAGKSAFIRTFLDKSIRNINVQSIDFADRQAQTKSDDAMSTYSNSIEQMFDAAEMSSLIVIDHFELASQTARHQIFQSWITAGIDKKLRLILIMDNQYLAQCEALSVQYKTSIQTAELTAFDANESVEFVQSCLEDQTALGKFEIPSRLRSEFSAANGNPAKLIQFAGNHKNLLVRGRRTDKVRKKSVLWLFGCFPVIAALGYYGYGEFLSNSSSNITTILTQENTSAQIAKDPSPAQDLSESTERTAVLNTDDKSNSAVNNPALQDGDSAIITDITESKIDNTEIENQQNDIAISSTVPLKRDEEWFKALLEDSKQWVNSTADSKATIQIMSVDKARFEFESLQRFINDLSDEDLGQLKILSIELNQGSVYGLFYGEFDDRRQASNQIKNLSATLKASQPFPRSIEGIRQDLSIN